MTAQDEQIANALREMADKAAIPRLRIGTAWRAGRRRRTTTMTASVAGAAGAVAAAALVPLALTSGSAHSGPGAGPLPAAHSGVPGGSHPPVAKVELSRVSKVVSKPCPHGSHGVPSLSGHACYYLAGKPMSATVESARVVSASGKQDNNQPVYVIDISLARSDAAALGTLTAHIMNTPPPRDEIAWIVHGVVVASPGTEGPLPTSFQLGTNHDTRAAQQQLLNEIEGHFPTHGR